MARTRLGLIGCGAIAHEICRAVASGTVPAEVAAMMDLRRERCEELRSLVGGRVVDSLEELLEEKPDYVVEAASQEAVRQYGARVLERGVNLVVLSVGALLDPELLEELRRAAERGGAKVYAPTGAIAGLDAVRAARLAGIKRVVLRTIKNPRSLGLEGFSGAARLIYSGPAREAVKRFPFNVNVAAALSLAAGREAWVEIVADPSAERNTHVVVVESEATRLEIRVENVPSPSNPRTSLLAALSVIELLRRLAGGDAVLVGS